MRLRALMMIMNLKNCQDTEPDSTDSSYNIDSVHYQNLILPIPVIYQTVGPDNVKMFNTLSEHKTR